jgi:hypothetical protein
VFLDEWQGHPVLPFLILIDILIDDCGSAGSGS